jgi:uncharacterized membrane protein YcaP (DUF421 family)
MVSKILIVVLRSIAAYLLLFVLGRFIGRKMISNITFFDFLVGVTLGSLAVRLAIDSENSFFMGAISAVVITLLALATDMIILKSIRLRTLLEGEPILLVLDGKMLDTNLKKARVSVNKLSMMLRSKDMFNISDVELAVIENNGEFSVLPKAAKQPATAGDLNIAKPAAKMPVDIIIDGRLLTKNLKTSGYDEQWLNTQLSLQNMQVRGVFYAGLDTSGNLYVCPRGIYK